MEEMTNRSKKRAKYEYNKNYFSLYLWSREQIVKKSIHQFPQVSRMIRPIRNSIVFHNLLTGGGITRLQFKG